MFLFLLDEFSVAVHLSTMLSLQLLMSILVIIELDTLKRGLDQPPTSLLKWRR